MQFDHEKLDVFQIALGFGESAYAIANDVTRGNGDLADQLRRAASSIVCNIAEGAGEFSTREKARFYRTARRSATECAAILELMRRLKLVDDEPYGAARVSLLSIVAMTVRLIQTTETTLRRVAHAGQAQAQAQGQVGSFRRR